MTEPSANPYAPPRAELGPGAGERGPIGSYSDERRSVLLCIALTFVTAGVYPAVWFLLRRAFLNALDADKTLGRFCPSST